jgi:hypothetical protein
MQQTRGIGTGNLLDFSEKCVLMWDQRWQSITFHYATNESITGMNYAKKNNLTVWVKHIFRTYNCSGEPRDEN